MATKQPPTIIEQIEAAIAEGRGVVRDIHVATKDLKAATKDARDAKDELRKHIVDNFEELTGEIVRSMLAEVAVHQQKCYKSIGKGFDAAIQPLMDSLEMIRKHWPEVGEVQIPKKFAEFGKVDTP